MFQIMFENSIDVRNEFSFYFKILRVVKLKRWDRLGAFTIDRDYITSIILY